MEWKARGYHEEDKYDAHTTAWYMCALDTKGTTHTEYKHEILEKK